jgi:DNA-binding MarR family transcriptional regulator
MSRFPAATESPGFLLWRVATAWRRRLEAVLRPLELTHPQFVVLASIGWLTRDGALPSQRALGQHVDLDPNTLSSLLVTLEKRGLVARKRILDERSKQPTLTKAGAHLLAIALPKVEEADAAFFERTNAASSARFLRKLLDAEPPS